MEINHFNVINVQFVTIRTVCRLSIGCKRNQNVFWILLIFTIVYKGNFKLPPNIIICNVSFFSNGNFYIRVVFTFRILVASICMQYCICTCKS